MNTTPLIRPQKTSQADLWRSDRDRHTSARQRDELGVPLAAPHQFELQDPFLRSLILSKQPSVRGHQIPAWPDEKGLGAAFLTWFVRRALRLDRLPFCDDRLFTESFDAAVVVDLLDELSPNRVEAITREVAALYTHTQAHLKAKGLMEVQLRRGIKDRSRYQPDLLVREARLNGQAGQVAFKRAAAVALGQARVQFEMDTLNSWSDDTGYEQFAVQIHRRIPVEDVLYCTELLLERSSNSESGEWVVINRNPAGIVDVAVEDIELGGAVDGAELAAKVKQWDPRTVWEKSEPLVLRGGSAIRVDFHHRPDLPLLPVPPRSLGQRWRSAVRILMGHEVPKSR